MFPHKKRGGRSPKSSESPRAYLIPEPCPNCPQISPIFPLKGHELPETPIWMDMKHAGFCSAHFFEKSLYCKVSSMGLGAFSSCSVPYKSRKAAAFLAAVPSYGLLRTTPCHSHNGFHSFRCSSRFCLQGYG